MKVQYFGDVHDFRKYVLLRKLAEHFKIGVCWMLTPDDNRSDGKMRKYLDEDNTTKWRRFDPELYDLLQRHVSNASLSRKNLQKPYEDDLELVEGDGLIREAVYFNQYLKRHLTQELVHEEQVRLYFEQATDVFSANNPDFIFLDPDNGLEVASCKITQDKVIKYLYYPEAKMFFQRGKSLIIYQHFPYIKKDIFVPLMLEKLSSSLGGAKVTAIETPNVLFLVAVQLAHEERVERITQWIKENLSKKDNLLWIPERPTIIA